MHLTAFSRAAFGEFMRGTLPTFPDSWWVGLAVVDSDGVPTEPLDSDYMRIEVPRSLTDWAGTQGPGTVLASSGTSHATSNNADLNFGPSAIVWSPTHVVIYDAEVGGDAWFSIPIADLQITSEMPVLFEAGSLRVVFGLSSGTSDYLANALIDLAFRGQSYTWPASVFAAYTTTMPTNAAAGAEPSTGTGYDRVEIVSATGWDLVDGVLTNAAEVAFPTPVLNQGDVVGQMLMDGDGVANVLFFGAIDGGPYTIQAGGGSPRYPVGALEFFFA